MSGLALRPYQEECLAAIVEAYRRGRRRVLIQMATGSGKTVVLASLIARMKLGRALILVHRDELIAQTVQKIWMVMPGADVGIVKAAENHVGARIVVASVQTVMQPHRMAQLGEFTLIVCDEAHHSTAESWVAILTHLSAFADDGPYVLGVTATPDRADGVGLDAVYEEIVFELGTLDLIRQNYLVDVKTIQVHVEADLDKVRSRAGDLSANETGAALMAANSPAYVARAIKQYAPERRTIIFTPTVAVSEATAAAVREAGLTAAHLDAKTPLDERRRMIRDLHDGRLQVISNCGVLTEGTDIPPVSCIVMSRPTKSRSLYAQAVGRGLRPFPGKDDCIVIDVAGISGKHKLQSVSTLFGLKPRYVTRDRSVAEAAAEQERIELGAADGRLIAVSVSAFPGRRAHWIESGNGQYLLSTGDGMLALRPNGEAWDVVMLPAMGGAEILHTGLPLDYAQGVAEDVARTAGAASLIDPQAPWRTLPVSDGQLWKMRKLGIPVRDVQTRGQASDLISAAMVR